MKRRRRNDEEVDDGEEEGNRFGDDELDGGDWFKSSLDKMMCFNWLEMECGIFIGFFGVKFLDFFVAVTLFGPNVKMLILESIFVVLFWEISHYFFM